MRLLVVDDNPSIRQVIRVLLATVSHEIRECTDGAEALTLYTLDRPDVVLMDIQMAGMDGFTATRQIKAADPTARIIIVTNYDQQDLREAAGRAGACGYVAKENLLELISLLEAEAHR